MTQQASGRKHGKLRVRRGAGRRAQDSDGIAYANPGMFIGGGHNYFFGSAHPAGFHMSMADGSVRNVTYEIDPTVFNALGTRNGDETVDSTAVN